MASLEVQSLLDIYPSLEYNNEKQKVICRLTKHEMPVTVTAIESYVKGRKFKNASVKQTYNYDQHKPFIIPSTKKKHQHELFCMLTLRHISKSPQDVERHVKGKRFQRALARWQKCQETGEKFVPRGGRRQPTRTAVSDSDDAGGHNWSDDSDDDKINNDDMSDLYPAEDFGYSDEDAEEVCADGSDSGDDALTENLPPANMKTASAADSDYDMGVLDDDHGEPTQKLSNLHSEGSSLANKKSKKTKKGKRLAQQSNGDAKTKKRHII